MPEQFTIYEGDCRAGLLSLPAGYLHTVVTSIPYYGLRAYGTAPQVWADGWRGELGSEPTPDAFVAHIVEVFRAVWHALRADGTVWLNIGDTYSAGGRGGSDKNYTSGLANIPRNHHTPGLGDKQLLLIPARVALALQTDGWTVRSEIIWAKPNPMPESVTDRPTKAHEQIYLLTKGPRYFYDADAIRETEARSYAPGWGTGKAYKTPGLREQQTGQDRNGSGQDGLATGVPTGTRNARTVWTVASEPYPEAHFATFPTELPRRCILAGTSARGCCSACGAPWRRVVARGESDYARLGKHNGADFARNDSAPNHVGQTRTAHGTVPSLKAAPRLDTGWEPTCRCGADVVPCRVGDPFLGSGTTAAVAVGLGRAAWGCELQPEYIPLIRARIAAVTPWYANQQPGPAADLSDLPLFAPRE